MATRVPLDQPPSGPLARLGDDWCGHRGEYQTTAFLCGRGRASDQLVDCLTCGRSYLASELDQYRRTEAHTVMPAPPNAKAPPKQKQQAPKTTYTDVGPGSVAGNITHEPSLRYTPEGRAVVTLRVAETERVKDDETGQWIDLEPSFYDVICWGQFGENVVECLARGDRIAAVGLWQEQEWADPEGQQRTKTVLVARDLGPSLLFRKAGVDRSKARKGPSS